MGFRSKISVLVSERRSSTYIYFSYFRFVGLSSILNNDELIVEEGTIGTLEGVLFRRLSTEVSSRRREFKDRRDLTSRGGPRKLVRDTL